MNNKRLRNHLEVTHEVTEDKIVFPIHDLMNANFQQAPFIYKSEISIVIRTTKGLNQSLLLRCFQTSADFGVHFLPLTRDLPK